MSPEDMLFAFFHIGGHLGHPSPMLSLIGKRGTTNGSLKGVAYHSRS
jgi:hypothetical protein